MHDRPVPVGPASHGFKKRLFSEVAFCVCLLPILSRREECLEHGNAEADSQVALDSDRSTREGEWGHDLVFAMAGGSRYQEISSVRALALLVDTLPCLRLASSQTSAHPLKPSASFLASDSMTHVTICLGGQWPSPSRHETPTSNMAIIFREEKQRTTGVSPAATPLAESWNPEVTCRSRRGDLGHQARRVRGLAPSSGPGCRPEAFRERGLLVRRQHPKFRDSRGAAYAKLACTRHKTDGICSHPLAR